MKSNRRAVSSYIVMTVAVVVIAGAFFIAIPMMGQVSTVSGSGVPTSSNTNAVTSSTNTGTSSPGGSSGTLTMTVQPQLLVRPGLNQTYSVKLRAVGTVTGNFTLSLSNLPQGVSAKFQPSSLNLPNQLQSPLSLALTVSQSAPVGNSTVTLQAKSGQNTFTQQLPLHTVQYLVLIQTQRFVPANLTVKSGATVYWLNLDPNSGGDVSSGGPHDVTALDRSFSSGTGNLQQYDSYSFTFTKAGTFSYKCSIHPAMTGQIVVGEG